MSPNTSYDMLLQEQPTMSRTHQYRKVMKPLLERKRRARINKCLDELKDLMVYALQSEGESIAKLEKADVLELTVAHLHKLKRQQALRSSSPTLDADRYRSGFTACAGEVSRCLAAIPGVDIRVGTTLMTHLGASINSLDSCTSPLSVNTITTSSVPMSSPSSSSDGGYTSGRDEAASPVSVGAPSPVAAAQPKTEAVWRPF